MKPDLSAPDGIASDVYGTFYGTSAASPHTAGAAALLLSRNSALTPSQIRSILIQNANSLGNGVPDSLYGNGYLRMPDITPPSVPIVTSPTDAQGTWYNAPGVKLNWGSTDTWSGVAGYVTMWDHSAATHPDRTCEYNDDDADDVSWKFA